MKRCAYGGMTLSSVPIRYQDGIVFQAGTPAGSARALNAIGRCVAARTAACLAVRSFAKHAGNRLGLMYRSASPAGAPGYGTKLNTWVGSPPRHDPSWPG